MTMSLLLATVSACTPKQDATEFQVTKAAVKESIEEVKEEVKEEPKEEVKKVEKNLDETISSCEQAQKTKRLKQQEITVSFPAAIECNFNEHGKNTNDLNAAGNGPRKNMKIRARMEQYFKAQLPKDSTICDVDFHFPEQPMQYDDEILLTMNNHVIMASTNYSTNSGIPQYKNGLKVNSHGLIQYKWNGKNGLYNLYYNRGVTPKYCLGVSPDSPEYATRCHIPPTEVNGQFKLDIPATEIIKLGLINSTAGIEFGFITTGDDDNGDCEHSAYSFDVTVKYIN